MDKPHVYFGLFLTALRNNGLRLTAYTTDAGIAGLIADALEIISPDRYEGAADASLLHGVFLGLQAALVDPDDDNLTAEDFVDPDMVSAITIGAHNGDVLPEQPAVAPGFVEVDLSPEQHEALTLSGVMVEVAREASPLSDFLGPPYIVEGVMVDPTTRILGFAVLEGRHNGAAVVKLAYDQEQASNWVVSSSSQYRNRQMPGPTYVTVPLVALEL